MDKQHHTPLTLWRQKVYTTRSSIWIGLFSGCPTGKDKRKERQMPKMKTKKCAVKRMKLSKGGKILRSQGGHAHLNNGKKRSRKNNLCGRTTIENHKVTKTYARALQGR